MPWEAVAGPGGLGGLPWRELTRSRGGLRRPGGFHVASGSTFVQPAEPWPREQPPGFADLLLLLVNAATTLVSWALCLTRLQGHVPSYLGASRCPLHS